MAKKQNKGEKQEHMDKAQVQDTIAERKERLIDNETKVELEKVLVKNGRALQPYIEYNEVAMVPRLRLVRLSKEQIEKNKEVENAKAEESV